MLASERCKLGHTLIDANTKWYTHTGNGKRYRTCRLCHNRRDKLKYRNDDAHRERQKTIRLAAYYRRKEERVC